MSLTRYRHVNIDRLNAEILVEGQGRNLLVYSYDLPGMILITSDAHITGSGKRVSSLTI